MKNNKFNYFIVFSIIILSGRTIRTPYIDVAVLILISLIILFHSRSNNLRKKYLYFYTIFLCINIIYYFKFQYLEFGVILRYLVYIYFLFLSINLVGSFFFVYYYKIIYILSFISLLLFLAQQIISNTVSSICKVFESLIPIFYSSNNIGNILIYRIRNDLIDRNCGFAWEPGGYGAFLSLALFIGLVLNKNKFDRKFIIILLAIITTFSTTAYLNIILILIFYLLNKKINIKKITLIPVIIFLIFIIVKIDFITDKIFFQFTTSEQVVDSAFSSRNRGRESFSLGRFGSLRVDFSDWKKNPFFGSGFQNVDTTESHYTKLRFTNGLSKFLSNFGLIGMIWIFISINITLKHFLKQKGIMGYYIFAISIFFSFFSNPILLTLVFLYLQLACLSNIKYYEIKINNNYTNI